MNRIVLLLALSIAVVLNASAADVHGVSFAPSPAANWHCGLSNEDLPGLLLEGMEQPIAAGCRNGDATAYAVIVDLSSNRSAMSAEQMAADSEDGLPSSWKVDSKQYDVVTLASGAFAAYSKLIGRGDGFTLASGQKPMVAISANVPLLFEDASGTPRQVIAVFRLRSPLPAAAERKQRIAELDRLLRDWAGTALAGGRTISDRDFELAAYARTKGLTSATAAAPATPAPEPAKSEKDRVVAALVAATNQRATADDLAVLEAAAKRFPESGLGAMAQSFVTDTQRSKEQTEQEQILVATLDAAKERAAEVFSRYLRAAIAQRDAAGVAAAMRIAKQRGWSDRALFEAPSADLLAYLRTTSAVPKIADLARPDRDLWRLHNRRELPQKTYFVETSQSLGVLEQQQGATYRLRPVTNLLDVM